MPIITYACVWIGQRYGKEYVERLRSMVLRHSKGYRVRVICLTDRREQIEGVEMIDVSEYQLDRWWPKMILFDPTIRGRGDCIYLDLDTVVVDRLRPLIELETRFSICANFTRRAGSINYPCGYGSCVMRFGDGFGSDVWQAFRENAASIMTSCGNYGDQLAIERLHPGAPLLQDILPAGFFVGRREFNEKVPEGASLMIFAGPEKPHTSRHSWVREHWK